MVQGIQGLEILVRILLQLNQLQLKPPGRQKKGTGFISLKLAFLVQEVLRALGQFDLLWYDSAISLDSYLLISCQFFPDLGRREGPAPS